MIDQTASHVNLAGGRGETVRIVESIMKLSVSCVLMGRKVNISENLLGTCSLEVKNMCLDTEEARLPRLW